MQVATTQCKVCLKWSKKCTEEFSWWRENLCHQKAAESSCLHPPFHVLLTGMWGDSLCLEDFCRGQGMRAWSSPNRAIIWLSYQQQVKLIPCRQLRMWEVQFPLCYHSSPAPNVYFSPVLLIIMYSFLVLSLFWFSGLLGHLLLLWVILIHKELSYRQ